MTSIECLTHLGFSGQALEETLNALLVGQSERIERFVRLLEAPPLPTVCVIGKYNHGKSQLLNALSGISRFAVADKRQTVTLEESVHEGIRWIDTPGLDADVAFEDDRLALLAILRESDIRLFVHAAKEGELDQAETKLLNELVTDDESSHRRTLFVLTQIDQLPSELQLETVVRSIEARLPARMPVVRTCSSRYLNGTRDGKRLLVEKSGIPSLRGILNLAVNEIAAHRKEEISATARGYAEWVWKFHEEKLRECTELCRLEAEKLQIYELELAAVLKSIRKKMGYSE